MVFWLKKGAVLELIFAILGDFFMILFSMPCRRLFLTILEPNSLQKESFLGGFLVTFCVHAKKAEIELSPRFALSLARPEGAGNHTFLTTFSYFFLGRLPGVYF